MLRWTRGVLVNPYQRVFVLLGQNLGSVALHRHLVQSLGHLGQPVQHLHLLFAEQPGVGQRLLQQSRAPEAAVGELRVTRPHRPHPLAQPITVRRAAERQQRSAEGLEEVHLWLSGGDVLLERLGNVCVCERDSVCVCVFDMKRGEKQQQNRKQTDDNSKYNTQMKNYEFK